jgi:hypothetical protein
MIVWPVILPLPKIDFSGGTASNNVRSSTSVSGRIAQRRRFSGELFTFGATWEMTDFQYGMFQSWALHKINGGSDFFQIGLPTGGGGIRTVSARIVGGDYDGKYTQYNEWIVTAKLEVEDSLIWDVAYLNTLLAHPSSTDWPAELPGTSANLDGAINVGCTRTSMASGRIRQQRCFTTDLRLLPTTWRMTDLQLGIFRAWVLHKITGGQDYFAISLSTGGDGLKVVSARIVEGKYNIKSVGPDQWDVTAQLEVEDALVWDEGTFDMQVMTDDELNALETEVTRIHNFTYN